MFFSKFSYLLFEEFCYSILTSLEKSVVIFFFLENATH